MSRKLRLVHDGDDPEDGGHEVAVPDEPQTPMVPDEPGEMVETDGIVDGEIVDESEQSASRTSLLPARMSGRAMVLRPAPWLVTWVLDPAVTVGQGYLSWLRRAYDGLTLGVYRRQIRSADAVGDGEALAAWLDRKQRAVAERHARLMDLPLLAVGVARFAAISVAGVVALLLLLSIAVWATGVGGFGSVFLWIGGAIRWIMTVLSVVWTPLLACLPVVVLVAAWREGRRSGVTPTWLVADPVEATSRDVIPDEGAILNALRHLGISELNRAFKRGWRPRFVLPTQRDGKGYRTQLELPEGVTVETVNLKKKVLAHNLVRFPIEVWPTEPRDLPGVLDLWVADKGSLTCAVEPWPLLHEGGASYFKGIPVAVDIRGKTVIGQLFEKNYAIAGMMGSGKSTLIITLLLGALLDPLVEADVFVMAANADYDPMAPRLRTLMTGTGEDVVAACLGALRSAYNELDVRGKALKEHGARAVTRELAEKDARLRPRIIVIDECQALFMHQEYGSEAVELAVKLESAARKYAVTIVYATPEPSSDSLPRRLITITSNRACFAIGDQTSNDAVLGTGSYKAGISAVGLEPKTDEGDGDVGTFMARGFTAKPGLLRGYYVSQEQAGPVVERAMKLRRATTMSTPAQDRDLLNDLDEVLGDERVKLADLPALLRDLAPDWPLYQRLDGKSLREVLHREYGVRTTNTANVPRLDPADLRLVLASRGVDE